MKRSYTPEFKALCEEAKRHITEINLEQAHHKLSSPNPPILIDVREQREFEQEGHLPDAIHLCRGEIEVDIHLHLPSHSAEAILYCGSGNRSGLAIVNLQKMGYTHLYSLEGGFKAWVKAGLPVESIKS